jgi:hypothetical protein
VEITQGKIDSLKELVNITKMLANVSTRALIMSIPKYTTRCLDINTNETIHQNNIAIGGPVNLGKNIELLSPHFRFPIERSRIATNHPAQEQHNSIAAWWFA